MNDDRERSGEHTVNSEKWVIQSVNSCYLLAGDLRCVLSFIEGYTYSRYDNIMFFLSDFFFSIVSTEIENNILMQISFLHYI